MIGHRHDSSPVGGLKDPIFETSNDQLLSTENSTCPKNLSFLTKIVEDSKESLITEEDQISKLEFTQNLSRNDPEDVSLINLGARRNALNSYEDLKIEIHEAGIGTKKTSICSTTEILTPITGGDNPFEGKQVFSKTLKEKEPDGKIFQEEYQVIFH